MATKVESTLPEAAKADVLVVPMVETKAETRALPVNDLDLLLGGGIRAALKAKAFAGKRGEARTLIVTQGVEAQRVVLVGLGKADEVTEEQVRRAFSAAAKAATSAGSFALNLRDIPGDAALNAEAAVLGLRLTRYRFTEMKSDTKPAKQPRITLLGSDKNLVAMRQGAKVGEAVAEGAMFARDLGNLPGNYCTPSILASKSKAMAKKVGLTSKVLTEKQMEDLGMGSLLSVSHGSSEPAKMIILEHGKKKAGSPTICLVGKGLTFDSGGISIKPSSDMDKMRYDMCGGAGMIGTMLSIAKLKLPLHVVGIIPSSENMPGASATKPGDVVTAMNGKTIEVLNTDAEGRLILADALCYSDRYKPDLIIDMATLTGAVLVALGKHMAGMMGTDEEAMLRMKEAGASSFERVWQLPMDDDFASAMKGKSADLQNLGGRYAGTITAGEFLKHFTNERPWIHLDIAGVAWDDPSRPYNMGSGATGFGVRLLTRFLQGEAQRRKKR